MIQGDVESTVTVIVPVYRCEPYVQACLRSVLAQTRPVDQIVLVDDRGGDRSMTAATECLRGGEVPFTVHTQPQNRGLGRARNDGLAAAAGDLIWFLDSDDTVEPDFLAILLAALTTSGADFAVCRTRRVAEDGRTLAIDEPPPRAAVVSGREYAHLLLTGRAKAYACTKLFRRSVLGARPWDEGRAYEDAVPALRMALSARTVAMVDAPLYRYLYREGSLSTALGPHTLDLFDVGAEIAATVSAADPDGLWSTDLMVHRYRQVLTPVTHIAMRDRHRTGALTALQRVALSRVREQVRLREIGPLLRAGAWREAAFAVLLVLCPQLYSAVLRRR